jgi:hypothetical protein
MWPKKPRGRSEDLDGWVGGLGRGAGSGADNGGPRMSEYVRQPEATVDELRDTIETLVLDRMARENPGIDLHDVEADRVRKGLSWTAKADEGRQREVRE